MDILYSPGEKQLWFVSNYTYGLFYGYQPVFRPVYTQESPYTKRRYLPKLKNTKLKALSLLIVGVIGKNLILPETVDKLWTGRTNGFFF